MEINGLREEASEERKAQKRSWSQKKERQDRKGAKRN